MEKTVSTVNYANDMPCMLLLLFESNICGNVFLYWLVFMQNRIIILPREALTHSYIPNG